jgi:AcrR family transcriptional regulator
MKSSNNAGPESKPKRNYDNSRRQQQVAVKKRRVLETALKLMNSDPESFTMRQIALKARLPERTLYHLFGDRETLLSELNQLIAQEIIQLNFDQDDPDPENFVRLTFEAFERNPKLIKGYLDSVLAREARNLFQDKPEAFVLRSFAKKDPSEMTPTEATRWALICSLFSVQTWRNLADCDFADPEFRPQTLVWAMHLLMANIQQGAPVI